MKWIFFDLGATLVDESDVYTSRCGFAIRQLNIEPEEFMNKVYEEAKISPTPIRTAAAAYGVVLPKWDSSLEKLYDASLRVVSGLYGKYKLGIIANQSLGTQERIDNWGIGKYFDAVITSEAVGASKPDPGFFEAVMDHTGDRDRSRYLVIGDSLTSDCDGAISSGFDICRYNPEGADPEGRELT